MDAPHHQKNFNKQVIRQLKIGEGRGPRLDIADTYGERRGPKRRNDRNYCGKDFIYIYIYIHVATLVRYRGIQHTPHIGHPSLALDWFMPPFPHNKRQPWCLTTTMATLPLWRGYLRPILCHSTYHSILSLSLGSYLIIVYHLCSLYFAHDLPSTQGQKNFYLSFSLLEVLCFDFSFSSALTSYSQQCNLLDFDSSLFS